MAGPRSQSPSSSVDKNNDHNSETESVSSSAVRRSLLKNNSNRNNSSSNRSITSSKASNSNDVDVETGKGATAAVAVTDKENGEEASLTNKQLPAKKKDKSNLMKFMGGTVVVMVILILVAALVAAPAIKRMISNDKGADSPQAENTMDSDTEAPPTISQANALPFRFAERLQSLSSSVSASTTDSATSTVMDGYGSCGDLLQDVQHALESLANVQIEKGRDMECWWDPKGPRPFVYNGVSLEGGGDRSSFAPCPMSMETMSMGSDGAVAATTIGSGAQVASGYAASSTEDSYGTNNQVDGVEEADIIQSNGEFVFVAYGREIIAIDLNGQVLDRVEIPLPPNATQLQPGFGEKQEPDYLEEEDYTTTLKDDNMTFPELAPGGWGCGGPPQPQYRTVRSLLMDEKEDGTITLNVITTFDDWQCDSSLCGGLTTAFVYRFSKPLLNLELIASQDINGSYNSARGIGSVHHIVTTARIDTWGFVGSLYRCDSAYWNMTYAEYEQAALTKAQETVAQYAKNIVDGLSWANNDAGSSNGNACEHVVQISSMTTGDEQLTQEEKRSLRLFNTDGVLQNFVQIMSLNLNAIKPAATTSPSIPRNETLGTGLGTVESKAAGAFMAYYNPELYATATDLILAGRGWRYDSSGSNSDWKQHTFLMSFDLTQSQEGMAAAIPKAIGEVPGYLKNQFSMDIFQDHLRVATTNFQQWGRVEDAKTNSTKWVITTNSTSQVVVLQENSNGALQQVGFVGNLGPREDIKSVRFIGDRGYVVTFRTVDPLYSLDLSNPTNPRKMGELKISGFSEYMHPISGGDGVSQVGDYLLTVGKEANETDGGRVTGTKIAVFDVRDIANPQMVDDFVISNGDGWTSSEASYDHHAFRYLEDSTKLIIPLSMYDWQDSSGDNNFDGFVVYNIDVAQKEISVTGNVTHSDTSMDFCWGRASLESRSMVFQGNLMTLKSHSIKMTTDVNNLVGNTWAFGEINLDENHTNATDSDGCNGYWPSMPFF